MFYILVARRICDRRDVVRVFVGKDSHGESTLDVCRDDITRSVFLRPDAPRNDFCFGTRDEGQRGHSQHWGHELSNGFAVATRLASFAAMKSAMGEPEGLQSQGPSADGSYSSGIGADATPCGRS